MNDTTASIMGFLTGCIISVVLLHYFLEFDLRNRNMDDIKYYAHDRRVILDEIYALKNRVNTLEKQLTPLDEDK